MRACRVPSWMRIAGLLAGMGLLGVIIGRFQQLQAGIDAMDLRMSRELCATSFWSLADEAWGQCRSALTDSHGHTHELAVCPTRCQLLIDEMITHCSSAAAGESAATSLSRFELAVLTAQDVAIQLGDSSSSSHAEDWKRLGGACGKAIAARSDPQSDESIVPDSHPVQHGSSLEVCSFCDPSAVCGSAASEVAHEAFDTLRTVWSQCVDEGVACPARCSDTIDMLVTECSSEFQKHPELIENVSASNFQ